MWWAETSAWADVEWVFKVNQNLCFVPPYLGIYFMPYAEQIECRIKREWSSLIKTGSLLCHITSPLNKKIGLLCKAIFLIFLKKQANLVLNGEVIWQASDSSLIKELHVYLQ